MSELENLRGCIPINTLSASNFDALKSDINVWDYAKGTVVFEEGDDDDDAIYLLSGDIELKSANASKGRVVSAGTDEAKFAIAQLRPRQYTGTARSDIKVARINTQALDRSLTMDQMTDTWVGNDGFQVDELEGEIDGAWMMDMLRGAVFEKLPMANVNDLFSRMADVTVKAGDIIIKQGEKGDYYYVIKEGKFNVSRKMQNGKVSILATLNEGEVFGEESLLSKAPRNASVIAMGPGVLMRLSQKDFNELLKEPLIPSVGYMEAETMITEGAGLLDVRTEEEFLSAALKIAENIPLSQLRSKLDSLEEDKKYVICCQTGNRSHVAAFLMNQRGFDVSVLAGGLRSLPKWPG